MAEVFGIVTGVLGMLPLCRDGLTMIRDVFDSTRTLDLAVGRLELQQDARITDLWSQIYVLTHVTEGDADLKFEDYAKANPAAAKRVFRHLALMALALFDAHALEDKYGIKPSFWPDRESKDLSRFRLREGENLSLESQGTFIERCKMNMSFIKDCKFIFRKKDAVWTGLIDLIKEYTEILATYGPKYELEKMLKGEFGVIRKLKLAELHRRAEAATYEARHTLLDGDNVSRYQEMALAAQFSAVVKFERQHAAYKFTMRDFRLDPSYAVSSSNSATMALLFDYPVRKENRVVLIEWVDSLGPDQERDTRIKTLMLATPKPERLMLPKCYGMVEDPIARRFGLVLAPPPHIRSNLPQIMPAGAISQKRMPVSLMELLEKRHPAQQEMLELGVRFKLAKKLVEAVGLMFSVGWVHNLKELVENLEVADARRNIRSNTILFFPAPNIPSRGPPGPASGIPQPLGFSQPLFVGVGDTILPELITEPYYPIEDVPIYIDDHGQRLLRIPSHNHHTQPSHRPDQIELDYYQHPEKRWKPAVRYNRAHDVYSLGCVLLELGLWETLASVVEVEDEDFERVKRGFQSLTMRLDGLTGSIYANVVRKCLAINNRDRTEAEGRELSKFMAEIAASLDKCWA
ncbi:hypothetical protein MBM_04024 [Drepanopeziza brunnea f. sp. 'multigermtubi' MB_m1]|uniref:Protein kinase domain-containing protein n=1 Tax=Marssonina brunnea f. sp. multigermtubi (strain MB_m1) TaxID=1072389 RepID=K1WJ60_MARBU|nr:uncharacterized protein MBM_04024 [Drepanopeziza brunnea f. sp. 'multigermtubi' MB_m1]EKD17655.1 hypothetical protein MBM_04024 [Drepanopeziza brunnea f. sp. 'multigermtubi' MB_m1]